MFSRNASKFTFNYYEAINDLKFKIKELQDKLQLIEDQYKLLFNSNDIEELLPYTPEIRKTYKYKLFDPFLRELNKSMKTANISDDLYNQYLGLINTYKGFIKRYNSQIFKYNQMLGIIKGIESNRKNFYLIKFGYDKKNSLVCFLANSINENNISEDQIIEGYIIDKDYYRDDEHGYIQLNYRSQQNYIELVVIDMRNNKKLGRGSFSLGCIEDTLIKDINKKISKYIDKGNLDPDSYPFVSQITGTIGGIVDDMLGRLRRKRFYINNGYIFLNGGNFLKELA